MTATEHNFQIFQFWTLDLYSCDHGTQYPHRRDQCFKHADRHGSVHLVWVAAVPAYIITLKAVSRRHPYCIWESSHRKQKFKYSPSSNLLTLGACPELISRAIWLRFKYVGSHYINLESQGFWSYDNLFAWSGATHLQNQTIILFVNPANSYLGTVNIWPRIEQPALTKVWQKMTWKD